MPETPSVLSVGERCLDHGYSFHWLAGKRPYLLLPDGRRINLHVDGKIPYLHVSGSGAQGQVDVAAAEQGESLDWRAGVVPEARAYLDDPGAAGGPPLRIVRYRATCALHSGKIRADHLYENGKVVLGSLYRNKQHPYAPVSMEDEEGGMFDTPFDALFYFYYEPQGAERHGWVRTPAAVLSKNGPPLPPDD